MTKNCFILLGISSFLFLQSVTAQDSSDAVVKPVYIKLAALYDFPESFGASTGIDFPLRSKIKTSHQSNGSIHTKYKDLVFTNNLGFYHNPSNYSALLLTSFLSERHLYANGVYYENGLGLGVMRTFYEGRVYTVGADNTVKEHNTFGRYYGTINAKLIVGYDFEKHSPKKPFTIQLQPSFWLEYPYNSFVLPHGSIELGIKYHFKNWNTHVKQLHKEVSK